MRLSSVCLLRRADELPIRAIFREYLMDFKGIYSFFFFFFQAIHRILTLFYLHSLVQNRKSVTKTRKMTLRDKSQEQIRGMIPRDKSPYHSNAGPWLCYSNGNCYAVLQLGDGRAILLFPFPYPRALAVIYPLIIVQNSRDFITAKYSRIATCTH